MKNSTGTSHARFEQGHARWNCGDLRGAFIAFMDAAQQGDVDCQHLVGYFYDYGLGVRRDHGKALAWYRRAHRASSTGESALNIALILKERGETARAIAWLKRALDRNTGAAGIHLAELLLARGKLSEALASLRRAERCPLAEKDVTSLQAMREIVLKRRREPTPPTRPHKRSVGSTPAS